MDEIAQYNIERWAALTKANALFTRPKLDLDADAARTLVDPHGRLGELAGQRVLCLAGGGGQQSTAFALLGADVTVLDLSEAQLEQDRQAAARYGVSLDAQQGDMRDLSRFSAASYDIVNHAYSLNFVPDARAVFREVARVMRSGGVYTFNCAYPAFAGMGTRDWTGAGYLLQRPYVEGAEVTYPDEAWVYPDGQPERRIPPVREYRHTLGALVNGLLAEGFALLSLDEQQIGSPDAAPGCWEHFLAHCPPWLTFTASRL